MTTNQPDWAEQKAAELLPCYRSVPECRSSVGAYRDDRRHNEECPAFYRPVVAQALREARGEGTKTYGELLTKLGMIVGWTPMMNRPIELYVQDAAIAAAERRGYERAAKLMCHLCGNSEPVFSDHYQMWIHNNETLPRCNAGPIWNVIECQRALTAKEPSGE